MKRAQLILSLLAIFGVTVSFAQTRTYFTTEELPDLIKSLPAPPDTTSNVFTYDIMRYMWGKEQRHDKARADMAVRDAGWTDEELLAEFDEPFGMHISRETTPQIWNVLERSLATVAQIRVAPKAYYHRIRPFEFFNDKTISGEDDILRGEGSYPSGHTIRAWLVALVLSEVNPAVCDAVYARAWTAGESRVIVGAHWQTDVDASRVAASMGYSRLQTSAEYRADMMRAQEELRSLARASGQNGREFFVLVPEAVPDAILEIRYYSAYNFVGARIDGYLAPTALLTRQAADSLRAVSDDLVKQGYRLKIYDAYRPQAAVDHFVRWASDLKDTRMKPFFYPEVRKSQLFKLDYICKKSGHTRGSTVDLTLFDMAAGKELDMGGPFDWFGNESHPDFCGNPDTGVYDAKAAAKARRGITEQQFRNRLILRQAMLRHGFKPFESEWWHFTLRNEPFPDTYFNFPVN